MSLLQKPVVFEEKLPPPSRCEFVHRWLEAHEKYFSVPPPEPQWATGVPRCAYVPNGVNCYYYYYYCEPVYKPTTVQLPYIVQAPYRVSPMRPSLNWNK